MGETEDCPQPSKVVHCKKFEYLAQAVNDSEGHLCSRRLHLSSGTLACRPSRLFALHRSSLHVHSQVKT